VRRVAVAALFFASASWHAALADVVPEQTVRELLKSCDSADKKIRKENCDHFLAASFMGVMMSVSAPHNGPDAMCIKGSNDVDAMFDQFRTATMQWLRSHAEVQDISDDDGMTRAIDALYRCH
jgi:hypothetical protein